MIGVMAGGKVVIIYLKVSGYSWRKIGNLFMELGIHCERLMIGVRSVVALRKMR